MKAEKLQPLCERLKAIQESKASARCRFNDMMPLISELEQIAKDQGENSELYIGLVDSIAIVLRGIAIDANNEDNDLETCLEAVALARTLARNSQLRERLEHDIHTANQNKAAAAVIERRKGTESARRIAIVVCIVLGLVIGAASSGGEHWLGGAILGWLIGCLASLVIKEACSHQLGTQNS